MSCQTGSNSHPHHLVSHLLEQPHCSQEQLPKSTEDQTSLSAEVMAHTSGATQTQGTSPITS